MFSSHFFIVLISTDKPNEFKLAGKIKHFLQFWESELPTSDFVLNIVKNGYALPFKEQPLPFLAKNNKSSLRHPEFVEETIYNLLKNECIVEIDHIPFCCNPLTVAEKEGQKLRLVLDLGYVNDKLNIDKFKYENLHVVSDIFEKDFFFCTFDLTSGYHHIPINEEFYEFLGFSWQFSDGKTRYFYFVVLPFGLSSACYVFTKTMRPFVKRWRTLGIPCAIYIDDGIFGSKDKSECLSFCERIVSDLENAGLTLNMKKSKLIPSQTGKWLGFNINTATMEFSVPQEKILKLIDLIDIALSGDLVSAKLISRITGHLISMTWGIGPTARLFTRQMYKFIDTQISTFTQVPINGELRFELNFWKNNLRNLNGYKMKVVQDFSRIMFTDASENGFGGFIIEKNGGKSCLWKIQ